jgi:hypothetical protein
MPESLNVPPCATKDGNNESDDENQPAMGYQQTIMYGTYSKALGDYAREQAKIQKVEEKQRKRKFRKDTGRSFLNCNLYLVKDR